jgi:hypothetical protein
MIEIDIARYTKISRKNALAMLEQAQLTPDKFIAHKDKTFTAKFRRKRKTMFQSHGYEDRMEKAGEHRIAILKRPSVRIDRGPYITMRFAFTSLETLGLDKNKLTPKKAIVPNGKSKAKTANGKAETVDPLTAIDVLAIALDIKNLAHEAHKLAKDPASHQAHLLIILDELEKHANDLLKKVK